MRTDNSSDVAQRLHNYFHNWLLVQPSPEFKEIIILGQPANVHHVQRRLPIKNGFNTHQVKVRQDQQIWVFVSTVDSNQVRGRHMDYLVVCVDHTDHHLLPGYEYILYLDKIQVLESKRPL